MTYVNAKVRACKEIGFSSTVINLPPEISQNDLLNKIDELNNSKKIDGIIVQLPIPKHIDENTVIHRISHKRDVDGFHPINLGRMVLGLPCFLPATPFGIITLIEKYNIQTLGKSVWLLGEVILLELQSVFLCLEIKILEIVQ